MAAKDSPANAFFTGYSKEIKMMDRVKMRVENLEQKLNYNDLRDVEFVKIPFSRHCGESRNPDRYILDAGSSPA
jgi:hypothetical protein